MNENNLANVNMIIYHKNSRNPVMICKPDYLGFMGIFMKGIHLGYPVGTTLEIEFQSHVHNIKSQRISMIVNNSESNGTGLRLKSFERDVLTKWQNLLHKILRFVKRKN